MHAVLFVLHWVSAIRGCVHTCVLAYTDTHVGLHVDVGHMCADDEPHVTLTRADPHMDSESVI